MLHKNAAKIAYEIRIDLPKRNSLLYVVDSKRKIIKNYLIVEITEL